jgi:universal stress protein A
MSNYKKILVAIDVYSDYKQIVEKALKIAVSPAHLHIMYSTLPMTAYHPLGEVYDGDFFNDICLKSKEKLSQIAEHYKIPAKHIYCPIGSPAAQIHNIAHDIKADIIVIGTHGQSGLQLLLGSTANGVLHGVKCDVLAVKV